MKVLRYAFLSISISILLAGCSGGLPIQQGLPLHSVAESSSPQDTESTYQHPDFSAIHYAQSTEEEPLPETEAMVEVETSPAVETIVNAETSPETEYVTSALVTDAEPIIELAPVTANAPFYGIWCDASKSESDLHRCLDKLSSEGFSPEIIITTEWSNLNPVKYYVVTAGIYSTKSDAEADLASVKQLVSDAYVKYSGDYLGNSE